METPMNEIVERLARLEEGQRRQDQKLESIDSRLGKVERVAEFGQGAAWALFKFCLLYTSDAADE